MSNATANALKVEKVLGLRNHIMQYRSLENAQSALSHCVKPMRIMHGDTTFWLVCPADAAKLERAGYEYAN